MGSSDHGASFDASSRTRRDLSGVLTPASDSSLNNDDSCNHASKKRKRGGDTMFHLLSESFIIKPSPSSVLVKPRTLKPIALLQRADLPLSFLDWNSATNPLPETRVFEAHVKILELEQRMGHTPTVLIARLDDMKSFYAVEFESRGHYVVCKLGSWVNIERLCSTAIVSNASLYQPQSIAGRSDGLSLATSNPAVIITPESSKLEKKKRLAIEAIQSMMKRPSVEKSMQQNTPLIESSLDNTIREGQDLDCIDLPLENEQTQGVQNQLMAEDVAKDIGRQPTSRDLLETIRTQYLEALYLSKASLAYFAKGPLSRARAAFHLDIDSMLDMGDLVELLESMVLSSSLLEKKYKETIPRQVTMILPGNQSGDEALNVEKTKKRKSKKTRIGKDGLYQSETNHIRQWWQIQDLDLDDGKPNTTYESTSRDRITDLRIRETQLQIIVILEIMALQPLLGSNSRDQALLPNGTSIDNKESDKQMSRMKPRKAKDLASLIDIHVDRLCIWQSIVDEAGRDNTTPSHPAVLHKASTGGANAADLLRDFCVEVVVPFFSSRLPECCAALSRKLGGPIVKSPARAALCKAPDTSSLLFRPGAVIKRPLQSKPRRSLQRVLTDERANRSTSRGPSGAISLMRSATDSLIPGLKRELSETKLSSIQSINSQSLQPSRGGIQKSKRFAQREIDLGSLLNATDSKTKKANIEAELKQAISALKRPNRQLAGQSIVEMAEQRAMSADRSRKQTRPIRNPLFQGVQILATPKARRQKDVISQHLDLVSGQVEIEGVPPSSMPRVPQSVQKPACEILCETSPLNSGRRAPLSSTVDATPSKTNNETLESITSRVSRVDHAHPLSSPLYSRYTNTKPFLSLSAGLCFQTPMKTIKHYKGGSKQAFTEDKAAFSQNSPNSLNANRPSISKAKGTTDGEYAGLLEEDSIYKSLGWDEDFA